MSLEDQVLTWLHLCAMAAYFGAQFGVLYMLMPAAESTAADEDTRRRALIAGFRFYNPFSIAALGVVVITGAMLLTGVKAAMRFDYFSRIGEPLALKLLLAFVLIVVQTYITFGLAFRIGRQEEVAAHGDGERFTVEQVNQMLKRIRLMTWFTIVLAAAVIFVSLIIGQRSHPAQTLGAVSSTHRISLPTRPGSSSTRRDPAEGPDTFAHPLSKSQQSLSEIDQGDHSQGQPRQLTRQVLAGVTDCTGGYGRFIDLGESRKLCFVRCNAHVGLLLFVWVPSSDKSEERMGEIDQGDHSQGQPRQLTQQVLVRQSARTT